MDAYADARWLNCNPLLAVNRPLNDVPAITPVYGVGFGEYVTAMGWSDGEEGTVVDLDVDLRLDRAPILVPLEKCKESDTLIGSGRSTFALST